MGLNTALITEYEAVKEAKKEERKSSGYREWGAPVPFDEYTLPDFPIEVIPEWLREYVKGVAESTQTPVDAPGMAAISVLSTALAQKFYVRLTGEWSESLNTYSILALPPGNRKSSVFKALQEPITAFERGERERLSVQVAEQKAKFKANQKRLEQLEKEYAKNGDQTTLKEIVSLANEIENEEILSLPRFITEDVTPEKLADLMAENHEKMALLSAEGGGIFGIMAGRYASDGKANLEIFLKGFSGDYCAVDRMGRETKVLNEPALTIGLFLQPEVVQGVPPSFQERGLMPRFLYSFPRSLVGHRKITPLPIEADIKSRYLLNIKKLLQMDTHEAVPITFSNKAREQEERLRGEIEKMFLDGGDLSEMKEWGSKLAGQIIRIAGLLHVAQHIQALTLETSNMKLVPRQIHEETFTKACQLTSYFIEHAKAAYGCMGADERAQDAEYLLKVIKRQDKPVVEYREIQNLTRKRFKKAMHLRSTFFELEERGYLYQKREGRKIVCEVNPCILSSHKNAHSTHKHKEKSVDKEKGRGKSLATSTHNTHESVDEDLNAGNVNESVQGGSTQQNQQAQGIKSEVGNVGKNPRIENEDDEDLII
ncbi:YfjI family protein [Pseudalkalibacillus sp. JSM 102089]|uniref:YfjI family protein n=1 Tax=Pseudalkalibacillus sp. JSM 102089 TaxID=3229856 RepID=UPI00352333FB